MKLPVISGAKMAKFLANHRFKQIDQKGSHVIFLKEKDGKRYKPVVPLHKELAPGTLLSIIKQAGMTRKEFLELYTD